MRESFNLLLSQWNERTEIFTSSNYQRNHQQEVWVRILSVVAQCSDHIRALKTIIFLREIPISQNP